MAHHAIANVYRQGDGRLGRVNKVLTQWHMQLGRPAKSFNPVDGAGVERLAARRQHLAAMKAVFGALNAHGGLLE